MLRSHLLTVSSLTYTNLLIPEGSANQESSLPLLKAEKAALKLACQAFLPFGNLTPRSEIPHQPVPLVYPVKTEWLVLLFNCGHWVCVAL